MTVTDLALRSEALRLATVIAERYPRVHYLVNNAGAYFHRREVTSEGLERTFALNVLAPFLLTTHLLPRLTESAPSHVMMVTSAAHRGHDLDFGDLQSSRHYRGFRAYGRSKLALLLLTRELARRFHDQHVRVNAVHPGFVASRFGRNNPGPVGVGLGVLTRLFGRSPRSAAADVVYDTTEQDGEATSGKYFVGRRLANGSVPSNDPVAALHVYEACSLLAEEPHWGVPAIPLVSPRGVGVPPAAPPS